MDRAIRGERIHTTTQAHGCDRPPRQLHLVDKVVLPVSVEPIGSDHEPIRSIGTDEDRAGTSPLFMQFNAIRIGEHPEQQVGGRHLAMKTEYSRSTADRDHLLVLFDGEELLRGIVHEKAAIGNMVELAHPGRTRQHRTGRNERAEMMSIGAYQTGLRGDPEEFAAVHGQVEDAALGQTRTGIEVPNDTVLSSALPGHSCATTCQ